MKHLPVAILTELSLVAALAFTPLASAQSAARLHSPINDAQRTALPGNIRSAALDPLNDRGAVLGSLPLDHMLLQLQRSPESEAALTTYIATLNDPQSGNYHKWLTAAQLGSTYGPAPSDIAAVKSWLQSKGLSVNMVDTTGMVVDFSGNAAQVESAFHPAMHNLSVNGVSHIANTQDPTIPSALVGLVSGVVSLNDFRPHAMHHNVQATHIDVHSGTQTSQGPSSDYTFTSGSSTYQAVVPGDLAKIYNLTPLFAAGYSGQGQTIVVIEDTNVYSTADWTTFRSTFGLSSYTAAALRPSTPAATAPTPARTLPTVKRSSTPSGHRQRLLLRRSFWRRARTLPPPSAA